MYLECVRWFFDQLAFLKFDINVYVIHFTSINMTTPLQRIGYFGFFIVRIKGSSIYESVPVIDPKINKETNKNRFGDLVVFICIIIDIIFSIKKPYRSIFNYTQSLHLTFTYCVDAL